MYTARDALDLLNDFLGDNPGGAAQRQCKRAVVDSLREISNSTNWSYLYRQGRVATVAPYSAGTVAYTHTGGTYERQLTLTGGTWPAWTTYGIIFIANIGYEVEEQKTATVLTLTSASNPGADVASGTAYTLYRDQYPLPSDFKTMGVITLANNLGHVAYVHPSEWLNLTRNLRSTGVPTRFTIFGDADYLGVMGLALWPYADALRQLDFVYLRRSRPIQIWDYHDGTIAVNSGSATVTGSGVAWTSRMIGSTIRISVDSTNLPGGLDSGTPYAQEQTILDVPTATSLRLDANVSTTGAALKYMISDCIDIDDRMFTLFQRGAQKQLGMTRRLKELPSLVQAWNEALVAARSGDSLYFQRSGGPTIRRWAQIPMSADQGS